MRISEWVKARRSGLIIMAVVTIFVTGAWAFNQMQKANRRQMADELGLIGDIWGMPKANPANTKFAFCQRSENGVGLFECNKGENPVMAHEARQGTFNYALFRLLDWTPDGQAFACANDGQLRTYDPESHLPTDEINIGGGLGNFGWLSPSRLAAFDQFKLYDVTQEKNGWKKKICYTVTKAAGLSGGVALSDHAFAWRQDNEIRMFDFASSSVASVWAATTNKLVDFYYNRQDGRFYVNCGTNGGEIYASVPGFGSREFEPAAKIGRPGQFVFKVSKLNQGGSYAYLASNTREQDIRPASPAKNKTLFVLKNGQPEPVRLLGERETVDYSVDGNSLVIVGSMSNEPCGIWQYDLSTSSLNHIRSPLAAPRFSTLVTPQYYTLTNTDGELLHYYLWSPVQARAGKKYPLMICQSNYRWLSEAQVVANSGCYFAMAERPTFHSESINNWLGDVNAVYKDLNKTSRIDRQRAFLFGTSAEVGYVNEMLAEEPNVWRGAFLEGGTGPVSSADIQHPPELAMVIGEQDGFKGIIAYKEAAAKNGIPAKIIIRPGVHTALATTTQREIARQLVEFLHENK